jgi:hypothetical protein
MSNGIEQWWHGLICRGAAYLNQSLDRTAYRRQSALRFNYIFWQVSSETISQNVLYIKNLNLAEFNQSLRHPRRYITPNFQGKRSWRLSLLVKTEKNLRTYPSPVPARHAHNSCKNSFTGHVHGAFPVLTKIKSRVKVLTSRLFDILDNMIFILFRFDLRLYDNWVKFKDQADVS